MTRVTAAAVAVLSILLICSPVVAGQRSQGVVRGQVADSSGGVLPGVTVVATSNSGQMLGTTISDASGRYAVPALPAGPVTLTFQLEGFAEAAVAVDVEAGAESRVSQRLELASLSETVVVQAPAAFDRPRPRFELPPPPPLLVARPLPEHDRGAVCGPAKPDPIPEPPLGTIKSRRHEIQGEMYLAGAELVINGGLEEGLLVGRNLVVRRHYHVRASGADVLAEHSAGLVQIVAATAHASVAVVVYSCDEMRKGDFLASFRPEPVRDPDPLGTPAFYDAARILFADEGQTLGAPTRLMVIDRGAEQGTRVGQRFTLFRQPAGAARRTVAGDAVVVAVRSDSATIRIVHVTDAVTAGDWAAPQSVTLVSREPR